VKSYGQYCALAKALDHVGDRWSLLIVRELLIGPRRYSDIRAALPGIATNLLAARLRDLAGDGIVVRGDDGRYELTEFGRGLEEIVHGLIRWGGRWMGPRPDGESFRPEWLAVALQAMIPPRRKGSIEIDAGGALINVDRGRVALGPAKHADARVEGEPDAVLGVVAGQLPLSWLKIRGDREVAAHVLGGG
jgi:DNA-binding HxlR family transcriptional regulator